MNTHLSHGCSRCTFTLLVVSFSWTYSTCLFLPIFLPINITAFWKKNERDQTVAEYLQLFLTVCIIRNNERQTRKLKTKSQPSVQTAPGISQTSDVYKNLSRPRSLLYDKSMSLNLKCFILIYNILCTNCPHDSSKCLRDLTVTLEPFDSSAVHASAQYLAHKCSNFPHVGFAKVGFYVWSLSSVCPCYTMNMIALKV